MQSTFPALQGAQSTTFTTPPLDRGLTLPELVAFHAVHSRTHKLFAYTENAEIKFINYATAFRAQVLAASIVKAAFEAGSHSLDDVDARPIFGVLAVSDSITYATMTLGIQQAGAVPFPISTRNSAITVAHLLKTTGVQHVFVSQDTAMRDLSSEAVRILADDDHTIQLLEFPQFETLYDAVKPTPDRYWLMPFSLDTPALLLHSSGTSAFPKPISVSHRVLLSWGDVFYHGEIDVCGTRVAVHTAPMFHAMGLIWLACAICCGVELSVFKPIRPPIVPNATSFLEDVVNSKSDWVMSVPSLLEEWSHDLQAVQTLKAHTHRILYSGGPLDKDAGDAIHKQGIHLTNLYGTTETGPFCMVLVTDESRPPEWEYFRLPRPERATIVLVPNNEHDGLSEPVLVAGDNYLPNVFNTSVNGEPGFTTGDLVQEHPTHKGFYKIYGRADDQIMLSTGEKTNPVPLERILLQDPLIDVAIFFGRGRPNNGVLIQPTHAVHSDDAQEVARFRDAIWSTVSNTNNYAPAHSRLLKEMVLVAHRDKPLELTAKGTARRNFCLAMYEDEIAAAYEAIGSSSYAGEPQPPKAWNAITTQIFLQEIVEAVMDRQVSMDDDLFSLGCDSLLATYIRNNIIHALRTSPTTSSLVHQVPQSLIYQHPSIHALSASLLALLTGSAVDSDDEVLLRHKAGAMEDMVVKYSAAIVAPCAPTSGVSHEMETVLITGTTGRFGCYLLAQLVQDPTIKRIYALNRASPGSASGALLQRMFESFELWDLNPDLLRSSKITLLASDYAEERLGLQPAMYAEIQSQLTMIIHNAWRVDFNITLPGFEPLIAGMRRLIDLAVSANTPGGARLLFISSVSVFIGAPRHRTALEEAITDARLAVGMGYGESKWVAEAILTRARDTAGLRTTIVRVGQLSGDSRTGGWNKQEWVGAMARLGQLVRALPERDEKVSWVPVDIAATALIEMARSDIPVVHLVAPHKADWNIIFGTFAERLGVPLISYGEWAALVEAAAKTNTRDEDVQPLALASFFQANDFGEAVEISTARACVVSPTLANMAPIGKKDALLYLRFWGNIGHLHDD